MNGVRRPRRSGRLELTWTNKDWRLLAREDGTWDWVPPSDYRVAEVRLLHKAGAVGDPAAGNLLVRGDALNALATLAEIPEYAERYLGQVKLAYLDPPFNTQLSFLHYDDALEHSVWLTMIRDRLEQVRELLAPDGSIWFHCDDSEQAYLKALMDEIFGRTSFVATVVWQKVSGRENRAHIGSSHDYLVVYALDERGWASVRNLLPHGKEQLARYQNPDSDPRGAWTSDNLTGQAGHATKAQFFDVTTPSGRMVSPPPGRCWLVSKQRFEELVTDNRIWFGHKGTNVPRLKRFLRETQGGLVPTTWWPYPEVGTNDEAKKEIKRLAPGVEPFATAKPERLLHRILHIATNPGDLVLDCFLGSGTTAAVAHKMDRRWIGIEWSHETLETFAIPRLTKVAEGEDPRGITEAVGWDGGGGFHVFDVGPSMFEDDEGQVVLADWATNGKLAEATAAQLHYAYESDPPLCGRKGRARLAVIDGHVSAPWPVSSLML